MIVDTKVYPGLFADLSKLPREVVRRVYLAGRQTAGCVWGTTSDRVNGEPTLYHIRYPHAANPDHMCVLLMDAETGDAVFTESDNLDDDEALDAALAAMEAR